MKPLDRTLKSLALAALLGPLAAANVLAGADKEKTMPSGFNFKAYDANADGQVSAEEFRTQGGKEEAFRAADTNQDNRLSSEEFAKVGVSEKRP